MLSASELPPGGGSSGSSSGDPAAREPPEGGEASPPQGTPVLVGPPPRVHTAWVSGCALGKGLGKGALAPIVQLWRRVDTSRGLSRSAASSSRSPARRSSSR